MALDQEHFASLLRDLTEETADLVAVLSRPSPAQWEIATPSEDWNIHDQVVHLAYFDDLASLGLSEPESFTAAVDALLATGRDWIDQINRRNALLEPEATLQWFTESRAALGRVLAEAGPGARSAWFGPSMSAASSATARLMETWAHGQDIYDALGLMHPVTNRVRHVCHLGVITRAFAFDLRGLEAPQGDVRVELTAPSGELWTWGPADAADLVTGTANDFALLVTQRRHRADTALQATPGQAERWLQIAQAFAGGPGDGRRPGQFTDPITGPITDPIAGPITGPVTDPITCPVTGQPTEDESSL